MTRVVAAIIEQRGRMLICQRREDQAFAGQWEFPGGKMNRSETPRAALARELREELAVETNIGAQIYRVRHIYLRGLQVEPTPDPGMANSFEIAFFQATLRFGAPRNVCFQCIRWVRRGELANYKFLAADRLLVGRLGRGEFR